MFGCHPGSTSNFLRLNGYTLVFVLNTVHNIDQFGGYIFREEQKRDSR